MNFSIRFFRKTAVARATLFLWLFGFMVGVAHACLVLPATDARVQTQASAMAVDATQASDDCDDAIAQQTCISSREPEQATALKATLQPAADSVLAPGVIAPWREFAAVAPARVWHIAAAPPPGPPVAILFLRLTI